MLKQKKKYSRPRKPFDKVRFEEEDLIINKYGLKNKKEIWRAEAYISQIRTQAKNLIVASQEKQKSFINKLAKIGLVKEDAGIDDVLGLTKEDILNRRLQTVVLRKGFATKPKQARQLITHKHVLVSNQIVDVPSYIVSIDAEKQISIKLKKQKKQAKPILPEAAEIVKQEQKTEVKETAGEVK